jgi:HK97 family phage major capsid protein
MSEETATAILTPGLPPMELGRTPQAELEMRVRDEFSQQVEQIRANAITEARAVVADALKQAVLPKRDVIAAITPTAPPRGDVLTVQSVGRTVTPAEDHYYRTLDPEMRKIRSPEGDYWIAEWIRGMANLDKRGAERMLRAEDKMSQMRAVLAEQTITAVSGLAVGTAGGLIPLPFYNVIVLARDRIAKVRGLASRFISEANSLRVPVSAVVTVAIANEGGVAPAGEGAITTKLLSKRKVQGNFTASIEVLQDAAINIVSYFAQRVGTALGAFEDTEMCQTPGASAIRFTEGLGSATITAQSPVVANTVTYKEMVKMYFGILQQYRSGCVWMAETSVLSLISQILSTTGQPVFIPLTATPSGFTDVTPGAIGNIFGLKVYDLPLAAGSIFIGDPSYIGFLDGGGVEARTSEHTAWATDAIAYRFTERVDTVVLLEAAFRKMTAITLSA